ARRARAAPPVGEPELERMAGQERAERRDRDARARPGRGEQETDRERLDEHAPSAVLDGEGQRLEQYGRPPRERRRAARASRRRWRGHGRLRPGHGAHRLTSESTRRTNAYSPKQAANSRADTTAPGSAASGCPSRNASSVAVSSHIWTISSTATRASAPS